MQSMDERANELSTKVNQTQSGNATEVRNTSSVLTQNTTSCEVQSTILPTPLACNATMETESETPRDPERWANSDPNIDFPDYSLQLSFWDSDDKQDGEATTTGTKLFPVSQKTESFLSNCFTTALPNRRQWKAKYGAPRTAVTAYPNMDKVLKSRLSAQTKAKDKQLARTQALLLDAVGPLSFILEEANKGQLPPKATMEAAQTALRLLGNASANISRKRRRAAITNMNNRLVDMAEDDQLFAKAAPNLGDGFAMKAVTKSLSA